MNNLLRKTWKDGKSVAFTNCRNQSKQSAESVDGCAQTISGVAKEEGFLK